MTVKEKAIEFMMTYGWAILVVLVFIGALIHFQMSPEYVELDTEDRANFICNNLEKFNEKDEIAIYPGILDSRNTIENEWNVRVITLSGDKISMRQFDEIGVMCQMVTELCETGYAYCFEASMLIPISYEDYNKWR
tara:strand:+ start:244 stop:651 length:408 start_codon:yes stop_codon:yes gene_type:complete